MVWSDKKNQQKQIITSVERLGLSNEFPWDEFTEEKCPIPIEEFKEYQGIPIEIIDRGFGSIKNYLSSFGKTNFISFTGLK
jgi:hypothetical protein